MLIYSFAFVLCFFFAILFPPKINYLTKETNVNECERMQRKDNDWNNLPTTASNEKHIFFQKIKKLRKNIVALQREKRDVVVVTWSLYSSFM